MLKLGWFSTGRGPGSRNLLKAVMDEKEKGTLDIEIPFVFCNWDNTEEPNSRKEQREIFFDLVRGRINHPIDRHLRSSEFPIH